MTENIENTQPTELKNTQPTQTQKPELKPEDTQPIKPAKKPSRWRSFFIGLLGFLALVGLGAYSGYATGINDRMNVQSQVVSQQMMEQYQYALVDIQLKRYETAQQRLEYIISQDPSFPGASQTLTQVLVLSVMPTPTIAPTATSTPDFTGAENAYLRALQLTNAQDWQNALGALDIIRKLDPSYKTAQVDGMYYFSLRNLGHDLILKQGNLEGGMYQLTLAERFGPLDTNSVQLREGARLYIIGASFWELDWRQVIAYFSQVSGNIWDGDMLASDRLNIGYMRYGDSLYAEKDFCGAYEQYSAASVIDERSTARMNQSFSVCFPPTEPPITEVPTP